MKGSKLVMAMAFVAAPAAADLVSFDLTHGGWDCYCGGNDSANFTRDTGLPGGQYNAQSDAEMSGRFTIDTEAIGQRSESSNGVAVDWLFDQPGTGLSITLGRLTLFESPYHLNLVTWSYGRSALSLYNGALSIYFVSADNTGFIPGLSESSLDALTHESLATYRGGSLGAPDGGDIHTRDWTLNYWGFGTVHRVDEPAAPYLMLSGILALVLLRWRKGREQ